MTTIATFAREWEVLTTLGFPYVAPWFKLLILVPVGAVLGAIVAITVQLVLKLIYRKGRKAAFSAFNQPSVN